MRSAYFHRFTGAILAALCCACSGPAASFASGEQKPTAAEANADDAERAFAKLVDSIRAAEKEFANLETVVKKKRLRTGGTTVRSARGKTIAVLATHEDVATRTVLQGDLCYVKTSISRKLGTSAAVAVERIAAFDGQQTRTVEFGSAVNVHDGKSCLMRSLPPHTWPLGIDMPLSDFLAGLPAASDTGNVPLDSLLGENVPALGPPLEPHIAGEETVKGLACIRIEFDQDEPASGLRFHVRLWLAKERQLIPAKQEMFSEAVGNSQPVSESRVDEWQEVKKSIWLPRRVTSTTYDSRATKNRKETRRETLQLEKATLDPKYPPDFFRKVAIPQALPVFKIRGGCLVGSFPTPAKRDDGETRIRQIEERLRQEEGRYNRLSIDATEVRTSNPLFGGIDKIRTTKLHSLLSDKMALTEARHDDSRFNGSFRPMLWKEAFDGHTYRAYSRHPPPQPGGYAWVSSANYFVRNFTLCPATLRPHSAIIPWASSYQRLADLLWPRAGSVPPALEKTVEFLGEDRIDPFDCEVVSVRPARARSSNPKHVLWLAKNRNMIPVRLEEYQGDATLPVRLELVDSFHEPSPGVWYPAHKTWYIFRQLFPPAVREGYLFVDQTWDYTVQSVFLEQAINPEVFNQVVIDEGIDVQYFDKFGNFIRKVSDNVPEMLPGY